MAAMLGIKPARGITGVEWLPVAAGLLAMYVPTFYGLASSTWQTDDQAQGPIILAIIGWLIWQKRRALFVAPANTAPAAGFSLLVPGLLLYVAGRWQDIIVFEVGALALVLAGVLLAARGWPGLRAFWFAIVFIAFLAPLPGILVDALTAPLRQNVSALVEQFLYTVGYPIARDGATLSIGQYRLLVAEACSGLNSMFSLSALGLLYVHMRGRKSWFQNVLLLLSILPIAFCANAVRVLVLVLITYYFGDAAGQGLAHGFAGMLLFVTALLILCGLDSLLSLAIPVRGGRT